MKLFYILLVALHFCSDNANANDMHVGGRIASGAVSTSPRAYAQDHFKRRAGSPHRYQNWRYNYGNRPDRFHTSYGWEEYRPTPYPYMQDYYSSPHVVVRQPVIVHETLNVQAVQPYPSQRIRPYDGDYSTRDHDYYHDDDMQQYDMQQYDAPRYDAQDDASLPWLNNDGYAEEYQHDIEPFYPDRMDTMPEVERTAPYEPDYMSREIVTSPQQESLRHRAPTDPLVGLWNAIGFGYE